MITTINKRKRKLPFLKDSQLANVKVGMPFGDEVLNKIGIQNVGESILPSPKFGRNCKKNAFGYSYPDKTKPKEYRTIFTVSFHPYGNINVPEREYDVDRLCYPRIVVPPTGIELLVAENKDGNKTVIADLQNPTKERILVAINILVEVFGYCFVSDEDIVDISTIKRIQCNWKFLPQGEWPSKSLDKFVATHSDVNHKFYFKERLDLIESMKPKVACQGYGGFADYVAYLFDKICVLESAEYANATYIVPIDKWDELSKMTKYELFHLKELLCRLVHNNSWRKDIVEAIRQFNNN